MRAFRRAPIGLRGNATDDIRMPAFAPFIPAAVLRLANGKIAGSGDGDAADAHVQRFPAHARTAAFGTRKNPWTCLTPSCFSAGSMMALRHIVGGILQREQTLRPDGETLKFGPWVDRKRASAPTQ